MNISELLLNVIIEFYENDSREQTFGTDTKLYHSEIHMLQCIAENHEMHISGIARVLGITRGAASQTAKRLERKNMVVKESSTESGKMVILRLTPKGETAVHHHKSEHQRYNAIINKILANATNEQVEFLTDFLQSFESTLKEKS